MGATKKSVAAQALLEMDSIVSALKEESKKTLGNMLNEAVKDALTVKRMTPKTRETTPKTFPLKMEMLPQQALTTLQPLKQEQKREQRHRHPKQARRKHPKAQQQVKNPQQPKVRAKKDGIISPNIR